MATRTETIKTFDVTIDVGDSQRDMIMKNIIIAGLRPAWNPADIRVEPVCGGFINVITCFHLAGDSEKTDAVAVRTFNKDQDDKLFNRHFEFLAMQVAEAAGVFPPILGVFHNGIAYQYVHGRNLRGRDLHNPKIIRVVAQSLAQFHAVDLNMPLIDRRGNITQLPREHTYFPYKRLAFSSIPITLSDPQRDARYQAECLPPADWMKELDFMEEFLSDLNLPQGVSHHDLHIKNIIYNDATDKAYFVDYEFSSLGCKAFDFFSFYGDSIYRKLMTHGGFYDEDEPAVTEDLVRTWHREYLAHLCRLEGRDPGQITEYNTKKLQLECQIVEVLNHLHWTLIAYSIMEIQPPGIDLFGMISLGGRKYRDLKPGLLHLKPQYTELLQSGNYV